MAPIPPNDIERASHEKGALPGSPASPRPRRVSPRRLIASIFIFLLTFSFLHRPLGRRANDHFCRRHSVEQRARRVLSMTPLIGQPTITFLSGQYDFLTNNRTQMAMLICPC